MSHPSSLCMTVEIIAGTNDETAAVELQMLATYLGVMVEAKQRGIAMRARPGDDRQACLKSFQLDDQLRKQR